MSGARLKGIVDTVDHKLGVTFVDVTEGDAKSIVFASSRFMDLYHLDKVEIEMGPEMGVVRDVRVLGLE